MLAEELGLEVVAFEAAHARAATAAFARYGRGRHPARLNFGDCLAYAVAKLSARPLVTLDPGFGRTDLALALPGGG